MFFAQTFSRGEPNITFRSVTSHVAELKLVKLVCLHRCVEMTSCGSKKQQMEMLVSKRSFLSFSIADFPYACRHGVFSGMPHMMHSMFSSCLIPPISFFQRSKATLLMPYLDGVSRIRRTPASVVHRLWIMCQMCSSYCNTQLKM